MAVMYNHNSYHKDQVGIFKRAFGELQRFVYYLINSYLIIQSSGPNFLNENQDQEITI